MPRIPPPLIALATALLMWMSCRLVPDLTLGIPAGGVLAIVLVAAGGVVMALALRSFRWAETTVNPLQPQNASTLVVDGLYRISRNPMYLGLALVLLAWGVWLSNLLSILLVPAFLLYIDRFQVRPEEQALSARFGSEYRDYMTRVRRWL